MTRTHQNQFPEITIPEEITKLVEAGKIKDESWHNDAAPRFTLTEDESISLWVDHETPSNRENPGKRFTIIGDNDGCPDVLFATEKLTELMSYLADHHDL